MNDNLFMDSLYFVLMNHGIVLILIGGLTFLSLSVSLLTIIKRWGSL